jgi:hypothetical protein
MSGRATVMEDGRARESECGEHGMDELLVLLLSAVTFDKKWRDQFSRLVTKGLCAPVTCLLKSLEQGFFRLTTILTQRIFFVTYCAPRPWSEQWEQPDSPHRRRPSYVRYAQPSTERRCE